MVSGLTLKCNFYAIVHCRRFWSNRLIRLICGFDLGCVRLIDNLERIDGEWFSDRMNYAQCVEGSAFWLYTYVLPIDSEKSIGGILLPAVMTSSIQILHASVAYQLHLHIEDV